MSLLVIGAIHGFLASYIGLFPSPNSAPSNDVPDEGTKLTSSSSASTQQQQQQQQQQQVPDPTSMAGNLPRSSKGGPLSSLLCFFHSSPESLRTPCLRR